MGRGESPLQPAARTERSVTRLSSQRMGRGLAGENKACNKRIEPQRVGTALLPCVMAGEGRRRRWFPNGAITRGDRRRSQGLDDGKNRT